jgi:hypothetical protein
MSYLQDDNHVDAVSVRAEPTTAKKNDLKAFIKTFVTNAGGKAELSDVCKACHAQFPGAFTWGELEVICQGVQANWTAKRAAKEKGTP